MRQRLFNYTSFKESLKFDTQMKYLCEGKEICPTTGKEHNQGMVYFHNAKELSAVIKKYVGFHWIASKGTIEENYAYCTKDNKYREEGEKPIKGKRTDLNEVIETLKTKGMSGVIENHPEMYVKFNRGLEKLALNTKNNAEKKNIIVIVGEPGKGKTKWVYDNYKEIYSKPTGKWWDGYMGEETVLIDDYEGEIEYREMLKVLDRYPHKVEIKGGYVNLKAKTIIITSNEPIEKWYNRNEIKALERRIDQKINL